ncbi:hypothetical protein BV20DRAFT_1054666 [Pilatotrama ljubarskyi]|nr:hypothetical protein BV20DRAFT_1054666 [Pilatotrama ljubarskyi]
MTLQTDRLEALALLMLLRDQICHTHQEAEKVIFRYFQERGVMNHPSTWRDDFIQLLKQTNATYRTEKLREVRLAASRIRNGESREPVRETLQDRAQAAHDLEAKKPSASVASGRKDIMRRVDHANSLLSDIRRHEHRILTRYDSLRGIVRLVMSEYCFESVLHPLKEVAPARTHRRTLFPLMEQLRVLQERRERMVTKAHDLYNQAESSTGTHTCVRTTAEMYRLQCQSQVHKWKQDEILADLEGLIIQAETQPRVLLGQRGRRGFSVDEILKAAEYYAEITDSLGLMGRMLAEADKTLEGLQDSGA